MLNKFVLGTDTKTKDITTDDFGTIFVTCDFSLAIYSYDAFFLLKILGTHGTDNKCERYDVTIICNIKNGQKSF